MDPERWQQIKEIYNAALERQEGHRGEYLAGACAGDLSLRTEVDSLLASAERADNFIEKPAADMTGVASPSDLTGVEIGGFRILSEIGSGGMGTVYLAERTGGEFEQRVALKLVRGGLARDEVIRRFAQERRILASLEHPNIARLIDGGMPADGQPFIAMEYVDGRPLLEFCDGKTLGIGERLALFTKICDAVAYAHRKLVVHRDIKPSNIMVAGDGVPKLLDFGIAKLLETDAASTQTKTGLRPFTPDYASPEQLLGRPVATSTDIYSLGLVLFELLSGCRPFAYLSGSIEERIASAATTEPDAMATALKRRDVIDDISRSRGVAPDTLRSALKGDLETIVQKALRAEPERRYLSVEDLSDDMTLYTEHKPIRARRATVGYRFERFIRRNRLAAAVGGLLAATLVAGVIAVVWQSRLAGRERDRAAAAQKKAETINRFLQDTLAAPDPTKEGKDIKVIDVLDKAVTAAKTEFSGQPEVLAELERTIGVTFYNLEQYDKAEPLLRSAVETLRTTLGHDDPKTADAMRDLANLLSYQEKFDESIPLIQHVIEILSRLPENKRDLANAEYSLAQAYYFKGDVDKAESQYREVLDYALQTLQPDDTLIAEVSNDLANILRDRDHEAAIKLYERARDIVRPLPAKRMDLATCLGNLGMVLTEAGFLDEAEPPLRESLAIRSEIFGENSPSLAVTLFRLSRLYYLRGSYPEAIRYGRQAVDILEPTSPKGYRNLGMAYLALGCALGPRDTGGRDYLKRALGILGGKDGKNVAAANACLADKRL